MIRGVNDDGGARIARKNVAHPEKYPHRGTPIPGLEEHLAPFPTPKLLAKVPSMFGRGDHHSTGRARERIRPIDRVLKERARARERAILLRPVNAESLLDEGPRSLALTAGEHDRP
jgi:hypothetical protein